MNDTLLRLYHALPGPARSTLATLRGLQLRFWRYGRETEALIAGAREREHWAPDRWRAWQEERLAFVLHRAATQVPYYRELWRKRRSAGDRRSWAYLEHWPVLEKDTLRAHAAALIADDCSPRRMWEDHTSGTSGKPLTVWRSRAAERHLYALAAARRRQWYGVSRQNRSAILGGQLVTPQRQRHPPFWVWNAALRQLYMSSYHLGPRFLPAYFDALVRYRVTYIEGYTSSLFALAQEALRLGRDDLCMAVAITNAEPLPEYQRRVIAQAFHCPVRETYGMAEAVVAASECEAGHMHLWPEVGWTEVLEHGAPTVPGTVGELVCTGLLNTDMPLVRYRVGDRAALAPLAACRCGRSLPELAGIEGRSDDVLYASDGLRLGRLDPVWKGDLPIREAQLIQEALNRVRVRYAPLAGFTDRATDAIVAALRARLGPVDVVLEAVPEVPRGANGKFRAVVCALSARERAAIEARSRPTAPERSLV
jgi:phenylacetate-CoA ligase